MMRYAVLLVFSVVIGLLASPQAQAQLLPSMPTLPGTDLRDPQGSWGQQPLTGEPLPPPSLPSPVLDDNSNPWDAQSQITPQMPLPRLYCIDLTNCFIRH